MSDPTVCIYHANCQDGFSAAWAVWKRYGNAIKFVPGTHGKDAPEVTGEHVLFVDFSYKQPVLREMASKATSVTILDHHKSAMLDLAPLFDDGTIGGVFDMSKSGAVLAWEFCFPEVPAPLMLRHVQDRDLWQFALKGTREISSAIFSHEYDFETWSRLAAKCESLKERNALVSQGAAIDRKQSKDIKELLKVSTRRMTIGGIKVPVANLPYTMASDAANILAQNEPFAACYFDRGDGNRAFSLRSTETGMDVSLIASHYNGGGHRNAAGFGVSLADLTTLGLF